ncbi:MAG TPA: hypothetical protein PLH20_14165 [Flavobacterium sp.]|nr:hypothetical protein [Flavobacterium sp.]
MFKSAEADAYEVKIKFIVFWGENTATSGMITIFDIQIEEKTILNY